MYLIGTVDPEMLEHLLDNEQGLRGQSDPAILLSTGGGHLETAVAIYDFLRSHHPRVKITAMGAVDSAGAVILMAGQERSAYPNTRMYFHQPAKFAGEGYLAVAEARGDLALLEWANHVYCSIISRRSRLRYSEVQDMILREKVLEVREALTFGLLTEVVGADSEEEHHATPSS